MRIKQKHICWACGNKTENFVKVKINVYFVKKFECLPKCFMAHDIERMNIKIIKVLAQRSPWLSLIENNLK